MTFDPLGRVTGLWIPGYGLSSLRGERCCHVAMKNASTSEDSEGYFPCIPTLRIPSEYPQNTISSLGKPGVSRFPTDVVGLWFPTAAHRATDLLERPEASSWGSLSLWISGTVEMSMYSESG